MVREIVRRSGVVLFAVFVAFSSVAASPPRNWQACPATVDLQTAKTVYALGDTHGDYDRLVTLLVAGKLLSGVPSSPATAVWSGGATTLVVTGDLIDKWTQSMQVVALFRALIASAPQQGGQVVVTAGNHEAEFLSDPTGSKTAEFQGELKAAGISPVTVANGTDSGGIGAFLLCRPLGARVNDWFFSHAGSTSGLTFTQLTTAIQKGVDADGYATAVLLGDKGLLQARMKPPWWEKPGDKPIDSIARLQGYADALGVKHIVFGHQPGTYTFNDGSKRKKGTLFENFNGLVFLIDMGMSRGVGYSTGALLRIDQTAAGETAVAIYADGSQAPIWPAAGK
jgi:hypothetical protein